MIIDLIRSDTWLKADIDTLNSILTSTIEDFVKENDKIINIEMHENGGLFRFWIYIERKN